MYKQILINAKLEIGKRVQKTEPTRRSPLRKRRSALDCSAIEGEGKEEEEEEVDLHRQETKSHSCNKLTSRSDMYANGQKCAWISCSPYNFCTAAWVKNEIRTNTLSWLTHCKLFSSLQLILYFCQMDHRKTLTST